jgi:DNA invertase Pin-like site-specific DNA recombinase
MLPVRLRSTKIAAGHLEKLAIVYIRQSSQHQVLYHRESRERQYALADLAKSLGWPAERVLVIDDDQGRSGKSAENRSGFQRLLAEVTMDHVGIVLGLEMSRLARSSKDWHHLFELCGLFGTLLADEDGVYNANDPNDRLLLGLKGIMSEVELHTMRNRLQRGLENKAQRGELFSGVPLGYVILPNGKVDFDPDEQARSVVHLIFEKFDELGTARAVCRWLKANGIRLPIRPRSGPNQGQIEWHQPRTSRICYVLHHPIYAGAYCHGRPVDGKRNQTGKPHREHWPAIDQWQVFIPNHLPPYITWERYQKNQERLNQNQPRADTKGPVREGRALLAGLLHCGRCNWRMNVAYGNSDTPSYRCKRHLTQLCEQVCFGLSARVIDKLVSQQVLRALEPAALELSVKAQGDVHQEQERLDRHWKQELKRARYTVQLAERRYRAVDPENRLVIATLERHWEEALRAERAIQDEYDRFCRQTFTRLSTEDESRIAALACDIPALWRSAKTSHADRQAVIRCLIERVVVHSERNSEYAQAAIHWVGGYESRIEFVRTVGSYRQLRDFEQLSGRIVELRKAGNSTEQTAEILNGEGFCTARRAHGFSGQIVGNLCQKLGLPPEWKDDSLLGPNEWFIRKLARALKMPWYTLRDWAIWGWVHARQSNIQKLWIVWADNDEIARLKKLCARSYRGNGTYPAELKRPKQRCLSR